MTKVRPCPGVKGKKCGKFLDPIESDPHPTCHFYRGKQCAQDSPCDFCKEWSSEQQLSFEHRMTEFKHKPKESAPSLSAQETKDDSAPDLHLVSKDKPSLTEV